MLHRLLLALTLGLFLPALAPAKVRAGEARIAIAANFTAPAKEIAPAFAQATGHKLVLSFGATGQFYAQITQGAPFDVLLSADQATPAKAIAEGHAIVGTATTYARGTLALFSKTPGLALGPQTLRDARFSKLAIANPATAPYGAAAIEVLKALGALDAVQGKLVQGNNIGQAFQFVDTGNAEIGFVAFSQIARTEGGSRWIVPADLHSPIAQDAVLLKHGAANEAAKAFLIFLVTPDAVRIIEQYGYAVR